MPQDADQLQTMPDLASVYVRAMRAVQPQRPYLLVGCSVFGSLVATAVVSHLER